MKQIEFLYNDKLCIISCTKNIILILSSIWKAKFNLIMKEKSKKGFDDN